MKKILTLVLTSTLLIGMATQAFATTKNDACQNKVATGLFKNTNEAPEAGSNSSRGSSRNGTD